MLSKPEIESPQDKTTLKGFTQTSIHMKNLTNKQSTKTNIDLRQDLGEAVFLSDSELIELLKRPPKTVLQLRTKSNFQLFFHGINPIRMQNLLDQAFLATISNDLERNEKVMKRMELLNL